MKSPPGKITSDLFKGLSAHPFPSPLPTLLSGQSVVFSFNILFILTAQVLAVGCGIF